MTIGMEHPSTEAPAGAIGVDRRSSPRHRVLKGATLTFNRGYGAFECQVRNRSDNGAKLNFGDTSAVPATFDLSIHGETGPRKATVRWRTVTEMGVRVD